MILTVTANPALDVTYRVTRLDPGHVHRVREVAQRPGGKGVNVARVLTAIGTDVTATGFVGGPGGRMLAAALDEAGVRTAFVDALPDVRRTVVVVPDAGEPTSLWEPGPRLVGEDAEQRLVSRVDELLGRARALVVSGSLPGGCDPRLPARLALLATSRGVPCVVDVDGEALVHAAGVSGVVLMPNREELERLLGSGADTRGGLAQAAAEVARRGGCHVVATAGPDGAILAAADGEIWRARPVERVTGNPTGAGDAAAAAVARALADSAAPPQVLGDAVALSASAVLRPVAGEVDLDAYARWRPRVQVRRIDDDAAVDDNDHTDDCEEPR